MSEANTAGQGRFGPPPVTAISLNCHRERDGQWFVNVTSTRAGESWRRELGLEDCETADALEAVITEMYRLLK